MPAHLEIDLPSPEATVPFAEVAAFVDHARHAGVADDAPVFGIAPVQDTDMLIALRIELPQGGQLPDDVRVPRGDFLALLDVADAIEANDGDAREHLAALRDLRQRLTRAALERAPRG